MTRNLTINRKRLEAIAYGSIRQSQEEGIELARMALTTIDSEMAVPDYFSSLVSAARFRADKAMRRFPQPNYVLLKVAEEAGEVVQAGVHYAENRMEWKQVEGEIVQLLAMLIRLVTEGDQVNGITPPALCSAGIKEHGGEPLCTSQPPSSDLALEQNFRDAIEGIGHIRRALEETFGGLHGTHCEPDILVDCKQIVDAIYAAYRSAGEANSASPTGRVFSIRQKAWDEFDWWSAASSRIADCLRGNNEEPPA